MFTFAPAGGLMCADCEDFCFLQSFGHQKLSACALLAKVNDPPRIHGLNDHCPDEVTARLSKIT